jgi:hypothetical protein
MNSEPDTLPNLQTVLDAIGNLQQEINARFNQVNSRLDQHDNRCEQMRLEMMSFDARIDRLQAMSHENLNIGYNLRADVKISREEVSAWSKDVAGLQLKAA